MSLLDTLPHSVRIFRERRVTDEFGGDSRVWDEIFADDTVLAWVQTRGQEMMQISQQKGEEIEAMIYFSDDPGINIRDLILYQSEAFEVMAVADRGVRMIGLIGAECRRWTGDTDTLVI